MRFMQNIFLLILSFAIIIGCNNSNKNIITNEAPIAINDNISLPEESSSILIDILSNDYDIDGIIDPNSINIIKVPEHGTVEIVNGKVLYIVEDKYTGNDSFSYTIKDDKGNVSKEAKVVILIPRVISEREITSVEENLKDWYMQFSVINLNNGQKYNGLRLGEISDLNDSVKVQSKYSLRAFNGNGFPFIKIVSIDAEGIFSGEYTTLYKPSIDEQNKYWKFKVVSSDTNANMVLQWNGIYQLLSYTDNLGRRRFKSTENTVHSLLTHMKLIDLMTGQEVPAVYNGKLQEYKFFMNGESEYWFKWVLNDQEIDMLRKKLLNKTIHKVRINKHNIKFDLNKPPSIK